MTLSRIDVRSMFGANTKQPAVSLTVGDHETQMSPAKAREVAGLLLAAAEAAIGDAFLFSFVTDVIGNDDRAAASIIFQFREWRMEHKIDEPEVQP